MIILKNDKIVKEDMMKWKKGKKGKISITLVLISIIMILSPQVLIAQISISQRDSGEESKRPGVMVVPAITSISAEIALINACGAYTTEIEKDLLGAARKRLSAAGLKVRDDSVVKPMTVSIWRFKTYIHYYPGDEAAYNAVRNRLGVGEGVKDNTLLKGYMKVILGIDAVSKLLDDGGKVPSIYLLNATGRGDAPMSFMEDLSDVVSTMDSTVDIKIDVDSIRSFETGKAMGGTAETTVVYYPRGAEKIAERLITTIGNGQAKVLDAGDIFVVLAPDYAEEEFRAIPDWEPRTDETYEIIIHKMRFIIEVKDSTGAVVCEFPISIGSNPDFADKKKVGDSRTPEGDFTVSNIHSSSDWRFKNIDLAYGPYFIRLKTPGWTGIGIHGTNEPYLLGAPISHGCIRLNSKNIVKLRKAIKVGTKVAIVH